MLRSFPQTASISAHYKTTLNIESPCLGLATLCNTSGAHCEWVFTVISGEGSAQDRNCRPRTSGHGEGVGETLRSRWNRVAGFRDLTESDFDSGRCWSARTRYHEVGKIEANLEKQRVERWTNLEWSLPNWIQWKVLCVLIIHWREYTLLFKI